MSSALTASPCRFGEIYLHTDSASFDLHNCFDFVGFTYDTASRRARLHWNSNEYAAAHLPRSLAVEFCRVSHLSATPRDPEMPFSEDSCLSAVGGVEASEPTAAGIYSDVPAGWHFVFTFMSGFVLRIGAESVSLLPQ
jgi:hypothetical protein